jgi:hypothetical protein
MNDLIVFAVGLIVSTLVVFSIFSRVLMGMREAKESFESYSEKDS